MFAFLLLILLLLLLLLPHDPLRRFRIVRLNDLPIALLDMSDPFATTEWDVFLFETIVLSLGDDD